MSKICLCSSYDDREEIYNIAGYLLEDHIVFTPAFYPGRRPFNPAEQINLMNAHFNRIDISDKVLAIFHSKVGANTLMEVGYALKADKKVYILSTHAIHTPDEFINYDKISLQYYPITRSKINSWIIAPFNRY